MSCADCRAELARFDRIADQLLCLDSLAVSERFVTRTVEMAVSLKTAKSTLMPPFARSKMGTLSSWITIGVAALIGLGIGITMSVQLRSENVTSETNSAEAFGNYAIRPYGVDRSPVSIENTLAYDYFSLFTAER